ncbi:MerR family DNA-binding transcriptional regulator [Micromonospora sp. NPDC051300]|uniref:helix-turn-helix domain-containing protein n=1 Tax=Micromonospora sp. NPDC051300 TaxID=3364286 RepID=UPI0037B6A777
MDGGERYEIGELARRTGVSVKTIRFWADRGIVPPTDRGPSGHRRWAPAAVARVDLVRTLRELGCCAGWPGWPSGSAGGWSTSSSTRPSPA